jgi:carboxypeptidase T
VSARRWLKLAAGLALLLAAAPASAGDDREPGRVVGIAKREFTAKGLSRLGLDLLLETEGRIYAVVTPDDMAALAAAGVRFTLEPDRFAPARPGPVSPSGDINGAYHSYPEIETEMRLLERGHPGLARLYELGESLEGRRVYGLKISDNPDQDEGEPAVLFVGCHHAREWISVEVPFLFGRYLLENYDLDPAVRRLVDEREIWVVPVVNPDGLEYSIHVYRYWRKNRRANPDGSFGVDINRNYPFAWGTDDLGSSGVPSAEDYRGPGPSSEPETRAVERLFAGRDVGALVSFHSFSQTILYPWGYTSSPAPAEPELRTIGEAMAGLIAGVGGTVYAVGQAASALYLTNGDLTDWTYGVSGTPSYTIELPPVDILHGGFFNSEADIAAIFAENLPAMMYLAGSASRTGFRRVIRKPELRRLPADSPRARFPGKVIRIESPDD